jgi:hypothetical protein
MLLQKKMQGFSHAFRNPWFLPFKSLLQVNVVMYSISVAIASDLVSIRGEKKVKGIMGKRELPCNHMIPSCLEKREVEEAETK